MVMASAGVNVPGAGGDGVGNPTAVSAASNPEWRMRGRRRLLEPPQGSGGDAPTWVRRLRPAASRFAAASSSPSSPPPSQSQSQSSPSHGSADRPDADDEDQQPEEEAADPEPEPPEVQEVQELAPAPLPPAGPHPQTQPAVAEPEGTEQQGPVAVVTQMWPVAFGAVSMAGRMRTMEDTISLHPDLCTWPADGSPMHFFAVFDGHGGSHVSALCRDRMHEFVAEELAKEGASFVRRRQESLAAGGDPATSLAAFLGGPAPRAGGAGAGWSDEAEEVSAWRAALMRSFLRVDAMAALACACGRVVSPPCRCPLSAAAGNVDLSAGIVGSTAVVAILVRGRLVVANCGDSRAVLCRGPAGAPPVPLSFDHKPSRPDEMARIRAAGGWVFYNNGVRVRGILAMSRALGDRLLRPEVIAEPEITITERTAEDECLILASDGMWDVITNEIACNVARHCLEDGNPPLPPADAAGASTSAATAAGGVPAAGGVVVGHEAEPRCLRAASLLARLAIGRGTQDNISIIVVDLKHRE